MHKKNYKGRCEKRKLKKSKEVCRFYSNIQSAYGDVLDADDGITEIFCNVIMEGLEMGEYTSDFLCRKSDKSYMVRECVQRKLLAKPMTVKQMDASRYFWLKKGIADWGIVVEKEGGDNS